ncbi:unnamed protein product [Closterium sp. Naga37s-1]|nr:unnamed protein product [Closterium sp. Naga37s-1]
MLVMIFPLLQLHTLILIRTDSLSRFSHDIMSSFPRALPFPLLVPSRLTLIALLALIALLRQAEAYTEPPIPDGCVAEIAEEDREAMRTDYAALPELMFFWHDGIPQYKMFDDNHNVSYCCVAPKPAGVSCRLSCPLECTPAGRITDIFSDPSRQDMPGPTGSGGSCPPGALSPAIGDLAELSSLVFRHSCLGGDLPDSVTRLQKLTIFEMPENNFTGPIPPGLFRLPALRHVDLSIHSDWPEYQLQYTGLSGSLPDGPDAYSLSLEVVFLSGNALSGELPRALLRASALRLLDLESNNITGELPGEAGAYSRSIIQLILRNNSLSGAISAALAEMTALQKLDLGENRLSGAVPAALRDSESLKALDEVRLDGNALTGPFCDALLPARELLLGFNDFGARETQRAARGSLGERSARPVPRDKPDGGAHVRGKWTIYMDLSHNSLSGSLKAFTVLPTGLFDLSHNYFSGGIPEAFFSDFSCVDLRFNDLRGPLFDARWDSRSLLWVYDWDVLRVSNNSARMAGAVGAGYLPPQAPGVQASAAETAALLAVRDALLGQTVGEAAGGAAGVAGLVNGGNGSWAEILRSWDTSNSSACAWYGVGCTADGHVDTLHLEGNINVTMQPHVVTEMPDCEYEQSEYALSLPSCNLNRPLPPDSVRFFLQGMSGGSGSGSSSSASASGSLSEALGQLTHLTSLRISGHVLSGGLPPSLSRLSHLVALDLSSNRHLSGSIPPALFALPSLRELSLRGNNLTGEVLPTATAGAAAAAAAPLPASLESLDVGGNALSESIAAQVGLLTGLTRLALDHNRLDGSLPRELGALWMLRDLQLQGNALRGDVSALAAAFPTPPSAPADSAASRAPVLWGLRGVFPLLTRLDVSNNQLSGDAATFFPRDQEIHTLNFSNNHLTWGPGGNASWHADYLDLSHNRISAPLQDLFGNLSKGFYSTVLRLSHNLLSGPIPAPLLGDRVTHELDLSHNLLRGSIPAINKLDLKTLDLSHNQLTGTIPQLDITSRLPLASLDLSSNKLTGSISDALVTGLTALSHLDLSKNLLSGSLPRSLAALPPLTHQDLSRNKLKGSLPAFCQGKQRLASLLLSSNAFSGPLSSLLPSSSSCASSLLSLNVSTNQLSGSLPSSLSRFTALHSLVAVRNRMSGSIPAGLASLTALQELDVSWSGLSGTIPACLRAAAPSLQVHLAGNALSGSVPPSLSDVPTSCFRPGNPKLCGKPLPKCKKRSSKPRKGRV